MKFRFPPSWSVFFCSMKGGIKRKLTHQEMKKAFLNPIGTKPILQLVIGKKEVVILFDDTARPMPVDKIVPYLLSELKNRDKR